MKYFKEIYTGLICIAIILVLIMITNNMIFLDIQKPEKSNSEYTVRVISKKQILLVGVHDSFTMKFNHSVRINEFENVKIER